MEVATLTESKDQTRCSTHFHQRVEDPAHVTTLNLLLVVREAALATIRIPLPDQERQTKATQGVAPVRVTRTVHVVVAVLAPLVLRDQAVVGETVATALRHP